MFLLPMAAAIVAGSFAVATWRAALRVWAFALAQFAIASAALAWGVAFGWSPSLYRVFYLFGAVLNVGWLALGTVHLFTDRYAAELTTGLLLLASTLAAFVVMTSALTPGAMHALHAVSLPAPKTVMPADARILARVFSIGGSVVVLLGLLWSLARRRRQALGLALLAAGVVVVGVAGELARVGMVGAFSALLVVGIALMYTGFTRTQTKS